jgi:hypothetical protein
MATVTVPQLVKRLSRRGIHLWAEGSRIKYRAPSGALTPEIREAIQQHRDAFLFFLEAQEVAKERGWLVLEPGEAYEKRLTPRSALYLFREDDGWCVWRGYWMAGRSEPAEEKTLASGLTFGQALERAEQYLARRGDRK